MSPEARLLVVLSAIRFCHIIDFMIIMPLGKTIMGVFDISPGQFAWVVSAYAGAALTGNLISTAIIDRFDRRRALLFLFVGFTLGTVACALAPTYLWLLAVRAATGLFGGTLGALGLTIVADAIPLERRAAAMGWVMTAFSAASVVGVPAGIWIAAKFGWQSPFFAVAGLSAAFLAMAYFSVPSMTAHMAQPQVQGEGPRKRDWRQALAPYGRILGDGNQRAALLFTFTMMLGHFTIIPFIAPYMQINIGFTDEQVSLVYFVGGLLTVVLLPLFGRLADRYGRLLIFSLASFFALMSIYLLTNLDTESTLVGLLVTSFFFIVASGRTVPGTTMITSVVRPENRGGFMSIRQSVNEMALFACTVVAGFIVTEDPETGKLAGYHFLGYFTMLMSVVAVGAASRIRAVA